ncbi:hypothetical protein N7450_011767 [Penicillium hetheringtonii]|uniref:Uncharacterized protein n=1 Tax=Penicillium hetheringtonii TaxID=911720 RepID=A0AAD6DAU7_9EURO|nr:hypothetical protein N7450_011767 [Penicillium hetheringtonii]
MQYTIEKNRIQSKNIYNFDETDFAIEFILSQKIITAIETIYIDSYSLLFYLIFKDQIYIAR